MQRHQQRRGGEYRQDVRTQFRTGCRKEQQHDGAPHRQEARRLEGFGAARAGGRCLQMSSWRGSPGIHVAGDQREQPRHGADHDHRNEVPGRLIATVSLGEKALEVLLHEEELHELLVGQRHRHEPWHRDHQEQCQARQPVHALQTLPVALQKDISQQRRARQHDADQSLGQHRQRHGRPGGQHPVAFLRRRGAVTQRHQAGEDGARHEKAHAHVQRQEVSDEGIDGGAGQHGGGEESCGWAEYPVADQIHQQHAQKAGQCRPQPRRPLAFAEQRVGRGGGPVLQGRFLEILEVVQARRGPVAAGHHFAGDFGVASLVGFHQFAVADVAEPGQREQHGEQRDPAQRRRCH